MRLDCDVLRPDTGSLKPDCNVLKPVSDVLEPVSDVLKPASDALKPDTGSSKLKTRTPPGRVLIILPPDSENAKSLSVRPLTAFPSVSLTAMVTRSVIPEATVGEAILTAEATEIPAGTSRASSSSHRSTRR